MRQRVWGIGGLLAAFGAVACSGGDCEIAPGSYDFFGLRSPGGDPLDGGPTADDGLPCGLPASMSGTVVVASGGVQLHLEGVDGGWACARTASATGTLGRGSICFESLSCGPCDGGSCDAVMFTLDERPLVETNGWWVRTTPGGVDRCQDEYKISFSRSTP